MVFRAYSTIVVGFVFFLMVSEILAPDALCIAAVRSGLLPPAPVVAKGDGGGSDIDYVVGKGHNHCSMSDLGRISGWVSHLSRCARISTVELSISWARLMPVSRLFMFPAVARTPWMTHFAHLLSV